MRLSSPDRVPHGSYLQYPGFPDPTHGLEALPQFSPRRLAKVFRVPKSDLDQAVSDGNGEARADELVEGRHKP